jgi:O-antigen/teichoic acid export membrane protein
MKNSLARSIIHTFSTQVGSQVIAVRAGVLIARTIGPSAKGFFSYAGTTVNLVAVFFLGFGDALMFQFGKQKRPARAVHGAVMRVVTCVLAVVIPLLLIALTYLMATVVLIVLFVRGTGTAPQRLPLVQREDFRRYADLLKGMLLTLRLRSA